MLIIRFVKDRKEENMEETERKFLINALYTLAWKIAELETDVQRKKLSKKECNAMLTTEATTKVTEVINISPHELHTIIREISMPDSTQPYKETL